MNTKDALKEIELLADDDASSLDRNELLALIATIKGLARIGIANLPVKATAKRDNELAAIAYESADRDHEQAGLGEGGGSGKWSCVAKDAAAR